MSRTKSTNLRFLRIFTRVRAGDKFEITAAPDEPGVIELRRVGRKPNEGLVGLLRSCPVKGFHMPKRSKELPRDFEL